MRVSSRAHFGRGFSATALRSKRLWILDIDRTVIDSDRAFAVYRATLYNHVRRQAALPTETLKQALAQAEEKAQSCFIGHRLDFAPALADKYGASVNKVLQPAALAADAAYAAALTLQRSVVDMLEAIQQPHRCVVAFTGGSPNHSLFKLDASGLWRYFERVYCGAPHPFEDRHDSGLSVAGADMQRLIPTAPGAKGTTEGFGTIMQQEGIAAELAVACGDHPLEDVANAQALGIAGVLMRYFEKKPLGKVKPDLVIARPEQLTRLLGPF